MTIRRFEGKNVIVTGAGQGIGRAIAERFAAEGADVMLIGRRREPLEELAAGIKAPAASAWVHACRRQRAPPHVDAAVAAAHERWGRIDVLVNNAGHRGGEAVPRDRGRGLGPRSSPRTSAARS